MLVVKCVVVVEVVFVMCFSFIVRVGFVNGGSGCV